MTHTGTTDMTDSTATTGGAGTGDTARGRIDFARSLPKARRALVQLGMAARTSLDATLIELVQIRASQINGCAYCLYLHTADASRAGESPERLALVAAWREAGRFFTERERAALAFTESVTRLDDGVSDTVYAETARHFDEDELSQLLALVVSINAWNRVALATAKETGLDDRRAP
ncbi:carboxymuconolactone decarboxylase family protein [Streptomyces profundus]|uniref:carboxymuconolactone decarboxylase family protein n=1 Tax=Streptomyces profundus TaxID=2867410 RepID=UPI001D161A3B|nr:carboxymuconolactone decarboxylase family protein [Streptomyces sp. MA3_2.13]UED85864.1 carboxymuconolactone decarboxylase family protein [Streptomyces sp. MA3_2.13]